MFQWFQFCCVRFFHAQRFGPAPHNCAAEWKSPQLDASGSCGFIFPSNPSLQLVSLYCPLNKLCLPPIVRPATSHTPDLAKHLASNRSWGLRPSSLHLQYTAENWLSATKQLGIYGRDGWVALTMWDLWKERRVEGWGKSHPYVITGTDREADRQARDRDSVSEHLRTHKQGEFFELC